MKPNYTITLFGYPAVYQQGKPITGFVSTKALALLAYIAATGQMQSREKLTGLFWGDMPEDKAKSSLRSALYSVQQLLPNLLDAGRKAIALHPEASVTIDVTQFATTMSQPELPLSTLNEAMTLYQADFLAGFHIHDAPEFEEWALLWRERWRQTAVNGFATLATAYTQQGDYPAAIAHLRRLLQIEPWRESTYHDLMLLFARQDNIPAALKLYQQLVTTLDEELGITPMAETAVLQERLHRLQERPTRHNLPHLSVTLIGREAEQTALYQQLRQQRLVTLTGLGGVGKTTLALATAYQAVPDFLDGVGFVPFLDVPANATAMQLAAHLSHVLSSANIIRHHQSGAIESHLLAELRGRELLLILDNLEHVQVVLVGLLRKLVAETSVTLLATSREQLNLSFEQIVPLDGLADWASEQLFTAVAQRHNPHFQPNATDRSVIAQIGQQVGGVPLALELAAAWVGDLTCAEIAAAISQNSQLLVSQQYDRDERQRSVQVIFDLAWQELPSDWQTVLSQLALFRGTFRPAAAQAVAQASPQILSGLANRSLLRRLVLNNLPRYEVHPLLRELAVSRLADDAAMARYGRYFAQRAQELRPSVHPDAWQTLLLEEANLQTAFTWALTCQTPEAIEPIAEALAFLYAESGEFWRGVDLFAEVETAVLPTLTAARLNLMQSRFLVYTQQIDASRQLIEQIMPILRTQGTAVEVALALRGLSLTTADMAQSMAYEAESLALFRQVGDHWQVARSLINLAVGDGHSGHYAQAIAQFEEAITLLHELNDTLELARVLEYRGEIARLLGDYSTALTLMRESLALRRTSGDKDGLVNVLANLGWTLLQSAALTEAETLFQERLALVEGVALLPSLCGLGQVALAQGNVTASRQWLTEAERVADVILSGVQEEYLPFVQWSWGELALVEENAAQAVHHFGTGWQQFEALEQVGRALWLRGRLGWALVMLGDKEAARGHLQTVVSEASVLGLRPCQAMAEHGLEMLADKPQK